MYLDHYPVFQRLNCQPTTSAYTKYRTWIFCTKTRHNRRLWSELSIGNIKFDFSV